MPEFAIEPLHQRRWLAGGELRTWAGASETVLSPVLTGGKPTPIGSFPLLGEAEAMQALTAAEKAWIKRQQKDGGWTYPGVPDTKAISTPSMTAAALASLYLCRDVTSLASGP